MRKYDWSTVARDVVRVYETVTATAAGGVEEEQQGRGRDHTDHGDHGDRVPEGVRAHGGEAS